MSSEPAAASSSDALRKRALVFGREVVRTEREALQRVEGSLDEAFGRAVEVILGCDGHVIVCGVGKPWFVAQKVSATLASTGTPSFPLHPSEAVHGDIGRVRRGDVVVLFSNSGASEEVVRIVPILAQLGALRIAVTGAPDSPLGRDVEICVGYGRVDEACPLGLAPSASSTAMLAVGDALALAVLEARDFTAADYARFHPAGALGRKLMHVEELMRPLERTAVVPPNASIRAAIASITEHRAGAALVREEASGQLLGILTDGDLRRRLTETDDPNRTATWLASPVSASMTTAPRSIRTSALVGEALRVMRDHRIDELPVVDPDQILRGVLDVQDLLDIGLALGPA